MQGLSQKLAPGEAAPNWPGCFPCKRALDNITKAASRQGPKSVTFVQSCRQDDDKLYNLIQSYLDSCPEATEHHPGKKRGVWSVVRYEERIRAASGIVKDAVGEMMWYRLYMEYSGTVRGGRLPEDVASARWAEWERKIALKDPTVFFDYGGPDNKLRIWIKTADVMKWRSEYMKEKDIICEGESVKKGGDEEIDKFRPALLQGHGAGMDFEGVAGALVRNGQDAFASQDGFLMDILDLQPDMDLGDEEENDQPGEK